MEGGLNCVDELVCLMQQSFCKALAVDIQDCNTADEWKHGITNGASLYEC